MESSALEDSLVLGSGGGEGGEEDCFEDGQNHWHWHSPASSKDLSKPGFDLSLMFPTMCFLHEHVQPKVSLLSPPHQCSSFTRRDFTLF